MESNKKNNIITVLVIAGVSILMGIIVIMFRLITGGCLFC